MIGGALRMRSAGLLLRSSTQQQPRTPPTRSLDTAATTAATGGSTSSSLSGLSSQHQQIGMYDYRLRDGGRIQQQRRRLLYSVHQIKQQQQHRTSGWGGGRCLNAHFSSFSDMFSSDLNDSISNGSCTTEDEEKYQLQLRNAELRRQELLKKKGRGWTDPWDIDELLESTTAVDYESLPDWAPNYVSRVSMERVRIYSNSNNKSTIPTLVELAQLPLPPPPPPHPGIAGQTKAYALYRKRQHYKYVLQKVTELAEPNIRSILSLSDWQDKQDAVDVLFEDIEFKLKEREVILGKHPQFGLWVERALEEYLRNVQKRETTAAPPEATLAVLGTPQPNTTGENRAAVLPASPPPSHKTSTYVDDLTAVPIFMDCYDPSRGDGEETGVPRVLLPLQSNTKGQSVGRMVEEWELSAHKSSKRIMLRQSTRQIAQAIVMATQATANDATVADTNDSPNSSSTNDMEMDQGEKSSAVSPSSIASAVGGATRIFVHGQQGVGKSAALAAIVASARISGAIVLYLPEGDQFHKNGYYIEPNAKRTGIFDLPILSKVVCQTMVDVHHDDLARFTVDANMMESYFTEEQLTRFKGYTKGESIALSALVSLGADKVDMAPMCYAVMVHVLMEQTQTMFLMVMDEFNCFFQPGQYYHQDYDYEVKRPIPYAQISLFQPFLSAMAVGPFPTSEVETGATPAMMEQQPPKLMKHGAIVVSTTESHAVSRQVTDTLTARVQSIQREMNAASKNANDTSHDVPSSSMHVVLVPRLSTLEVDHMVANYEAIGIGKLRLDRGETVMNEQEVAYLRMVSGGEAQRLLNACMM